LFYEGSAFHTEGWFMRQNKGFGERVYPVPCLILGAMGPAPGEKVKSW
jgi:hypothetical protein